MEPLMTLFRPTLLVSLTLAALLAASTAHAQMESREGIALQNQILELRRDLDAMRANGGGGGGGQPAYAPPQQTSGGGGDLSAALLDRITRLEDEVRTMRGQIDEEQNARTRQGEDLTKQLGDLNFKLGNGAAPSGSSPASIAPRAPIIPRASDTTGDATQPSSPAGQPRRTPEIALAEGHAAYDRHDYAAAEADAKEVLANGHGPRTTDAQYLMAISLAQSRDYQGAAVAYDDTYKRNPKGAHAQDSLVGLAISLTAIKANKAACETLDKARVEFPVPRPDLKGTISAVRQRAGCA